MKKIDFAIKDNSVFLVARVGFVQIRYIIMTMLWPDTLWESFSSMMMMMLMLLKTNTKTFFGSSLKYANAGMCVRRSKE